MTFDQFLDLVRVLLGKVLELARWRIDWMLHQPVPHLVTFWGLLFIFIISNAQVRWAIKTIPIVRAAGKSVKDEVWYTTIGLHLILLSLMIIVGVAWQFGAADIPLYITKVAAVIILVWVFAVFNFLTVRAYNSYFVVKLVWTLINVIVIAFTYYTCVWVLLAPHP